MVNIWFFSFPPYLRFFQNDVFNSFFYFLKTTILETTKESGTKNASEESESEAKAKGKAGTKEESKCEAEEAQHKAKETFEEESCKTETKSTKAREEVRWLETKSSLVCAMLHKNFPFQVNVFLRKHFYKYSSRKSKKGFGGKILKYGGNKKTIIFTIDNTNALKKTFTIGNFSLIY